MRAQPLVAVAFAAALTLVGCSSGAPAASPSPSAATSAPAGGAGGEVGVFTWWADGSEKVGLDALVTLFKQKYPNDTFVNLAVAGGAGSNAKAKLAADLQNGNPPDSFQGHAGAELQDYIRADQIEPVNDVIDALGGASVFPKNLLDLLTVQGNIYSVPSNIHRANVVWANPDVLKKAGASAEPADIDAWLADMQKLKDAGVATPLSVGGTWTQLQLFETVLIADLGVDGYTQLFTAQGDWGSDGVKKAVAHYAKLLSYANTASDGDDWPGATDAVINQFTLKNKKDGVDYTYFPVPGTKGVFDFLADSFTLPKGAKNPGGAKDWLSLIGSPEGQKAFNLAKGSIPARTDVPSDDFPAYQKTAMASFKSDKIAPSIAHGAAVSQAWNSDMSTAISKFYRSKDQATLVTDLVAAAKKNAV